MDGTQEQHSVLPTPVVEPLHSRYSTRKVPRSIFSRTGCAQPTKATCRSWESMVMTHLLGGSARPPPIGAAQRERARRNDSNIGLMGVIGLFGLANGAASSLYPASSSAAAAASLDKQ
jgi:hypothetical protein